METEKEIDILEYIYYNQDTIRQRDLAHITGVSLGMINVILRRLAMKGWIYIKKVNNRNIQYLVSPAGIEAISCRSYRFFKRTIKNIVFFKDTIENLINEIKQKGFTELHLVGHSEVDFLVEHFCIKYEITFSLIKKDSIKSIIHDLSGGKKYVLFCEDIVKENNNINECIDDCSFLREILIK